MAAVWQNGLAQSVLFWPLADNSWALGRDVIPNRAESPVRACPELAEGNLPFSAGEPECPNPAPSPAENRDGRGSLKLGWCR